MALQSSGQISIVDIVNEFGGAAPHNLTEYYRGGAYVPDGPAGNASIPTSGQITLKDFYGAASGIVVTVTEGTATAEQSITGYGFTTGYNKSWNPQNNTFPPGLTVGGSVSPNTMNGAPIANITRTVNSGKIPLTAFVVVFEGTYAKSFFSSVTPQGGGVLNTASANYFLLNNSNPSYSKASIWEWEEGTFTMPSGWNGTGTRTATFT